MSKKEFEPIPCPCGNGKIANAGRGRSDRCNCKAAEKIRLDYNIDQAEMKRARKDVEEGNPKRSYKNPNRRRLYNFRYQEAKELAAKGREKAEALAKKVADAKEAQQLKEKKARVKAVEKVGGGDTSNLTAIGQALVNSTGGHMPVFLSDGSIGMEVPTKPGAKNPTKRVRIKK